MSGWKFSEIPLRNAFMLSSCGVSNSYVRLAYVFHGCSPSFSCQSISPKGRNSTHKLWVSMSFLVETFGPQDVWMVETGDLFPHKGDANWYYRTVPWNCMCFSFFSRTYENIMIIMNPGIQAVFFFQSKNYLHIHQHKSCTTSTT